MQNVDIERALISAAMASNEAAVVALSELRSPDDCSQEAHRLIMAAIKGQVENSQPTDMLSVIQALRESGTLSRAGGASYISTLAESLPDVANAEHYAKQVKALALRRGLHTGLNKAISQIESDTDLRDIIDGLQYDIAQAALINRPPEHIGDAAMSAVLHLESILRGDDSSGLATGLAELDRVIQGMRPGNIYIIQGPTGGGKTVLGVQIATSCAWTGARVLFCSLEMEEVELAERVLAAETETPLTLIRTGAYLKGDRANEERMDKLKAKAHHLHDAPMYIDCSAHTPFDIATRGRMMQLQDGLDLVVVDYLQLMEMGGKFGTRQEEVQAISRMLKRVSKDLRVPVIALSQENADGDTRESKSLKHDASVLIKIERGEEKTSLHVKKNRHGPRAVDDYAIPVTLVGKYSRFEE